MALHDRGGLFLLLAVVVNVGFILLPVGLAALVLLSIGLYPLLRHRFGATPSMAMVAVAWLPYLALVVASGLTIGAGGRRLLAFGGGADALVLRVVAGLVIPAIVLAVSIVWGKGWTRKLAVAAVVGWVLVSPLALYAGYQVGDDPTGADDDVSTGVEVLIMAPFGLSYVLTLVTAWMFWRRRERGDVSPGRSGSPRRASG